MDTVWMPLGLSIYMCVCSMSIYKLSNKHAYELPNTFCVFIC